MDSAILSAQAHNLQTAKGEHDFPAEAAHITLYVHGNYSMLWYDTMRKVYTALRKLTE